MGDKEEGVLTFYTAASRLLFEANQRLFKGRRTVCHAHLFLKQTHCPLFLLQFLSIESNQDLHTKDSQESFPFAVTICATYVHFTGDVGISKHKIYGGQIRVTTVVETRLSNYI